MYKNKFIERIVNSIRFEWNLTCILIQRICNLTIKFLKFISNKKIEEEFEEFPFKLVLEKNLILVT